jgi:hypothetical protein
VLYIQKHVVKAAALQTDVCVPELNLSCARRQKSYFAKFRAGCSAVSGLLLREETRQRYSRPVCGRGICI